MMNTFLIILLLPTVSSGHIVVEEATKDHVQLAECALHMASRYITPMTNTLVVKERCNTCQRQIQNFNCRLLDHFLQNFDANMAVELFLGQSDDQPWNYYIFIVDNLQAFNDLRFHIPQTQYEREFYFLIILTNMPSKRSLQHRIMMDIFTSSVKLRILHAVIMLQEHDQENSIGFYTYFVHGEYCGQTVGIMEINRCRNGVLQNDHLFPPQLTNFHQCAINVSAALLYPVLGFKGDPDNPDHLKDVNRLTGIDGDLLSMIAKNLNFKISLSFSKEKSKINLYENSTGCYAELEALRADVAIGGLSATYLNRSKFSASVPYHQSPYVFIVRTGLHFGPLKQLANPFCPFVWYTIGLTIFCAFAVISAVYICGNRVVCEFILGPQNHHPNTNVITIFLGNPIVRPPRRNFARFLLMCWLLATLVLRNSYQGKLYDSLRVSRRIPIPRGMGDLLRHGYTLLESSYVDFYPKNSTIIMADLNEQYRVIESSSEKFTTISLLEILAYYNFMHHNSSHLSYVPEPLYTLNLAMYFQKHSVLKLTFDTRIQQLMYSGIIAHMTKQHEKREFRMMNVGMRRLPIISNDMLHGLYSLYIILMAGSFGCFLLELLSLRIEILRRFLDTTCDTYGA